MYLLVNTIIKPAQGSNPEPISYITLARDFLGFRFDYYSKRREPTYLGKPLDALWSEVVESGREYESMGWAGVGLVRILANT